ncbi:MAG: DUF2325 domain-containing protein [Deltaproteobacteria bacterium]|nr:DUF2325 domain-containing protein [Deltaproteobacteria bacterium]
MEPRGSATRSNKKSSTKACATIRQCGEEVCEHCPLQGRKVMIIGGLDRLEPSYRETVNRLGGECVFHTGKLRNGNRRLKQRVANADLVVFITSINSHAALNAVKKECKRCSKPFCALRQTGCGSLEQTLKGFKDKRFIKLGLN